jgi:hypothetical protein
MLRGRDVAGIGSRPSEGVPPDWNTYVLVDSIDDVTERVVEAGGSVVLEQFDWLEDGQAAIVEDHAGAALGVMERSCTRARRSSTSWGDVSAQHPRRSGGAFFNRLTPSMHSGK